MTKANSPKPSATKSNVVPKPIGASVPTSASDVVRSWGSASELSTDARNAGVARFLVSGLKSKEIEAFGIRGVDKFEVSRINKFVKELTTRQRGALLRLSFPTVEDAMSPDALAAWGKAGVQFRRVRKATPAKGATVPSETGTVATDTDSAVTAKSGATPAQLFGDALAILTDAFDAGTDDQKAEWSALLADLFTPESVAARVGSIAA